MGWGRRASCIHNSWQGDGGDTGPTQTWLIQGLGTPLRGGTGTASAPCFLFLESLRLCCISSLPSSTSRPFPAAVLRAGRSQEELLVLLLGWGQKGTLGARQDQLLVFPAL